MKTHDMPGLLFFVTPNQTITRSVPIILIVILSTLFLPSCKDVDSEFPLNNSKITCYVVEENSEVKVSYSQVNVVMNTNESLFENNLIVVEHLIADSSGKVELDRNEYISLKEKNAGCSFFICADGPANGQFDYYDDNCATGGAEFDAYSSKVILCEIPTKSWARFFIDENSVFESSYTHVTITQPWIGGSGVGIFPDGYDPALGFIQEIYANRIYLFPVTFIEYGVEFPSDSNALISVYAPPRDTIDLTVSP